MKLRYALPLLALMIIASDSFARTGATKSKKAQKGAIKLVEAYTQRTIPGIPGGKTVTETNFVIVWTSATNPKSFFWRGDNGWLNCNTLRAHKVSAKAAASMPPGIIYNTEEVPFDQIKKGDTLLLTPVKGGKYAVPAEVPATAKNKLYYQYGGSKWLSLAIDNIGKKPDIAMP